MQINKSKKPSSRQSSNTLFDSDFASGFEDSKFDKFKPIIKSLVAIIVIAGITWGAISYFGSTDTKNDTNKNYTPDSVQKIEDTSSDTQGAEAAEPSLESDTTQHPEEPTSSSSTPQSSSSNSTPATKAYDPSKCEPLNSEATRLRQAADQKKTAYDNAFAARKNYGYFYDKYGNSTDAQQAYNNQEAQLDLLQTDWQDALNKGNVAYAKYQECRANL